LGGLQIVSRGDPRIGFLRNRSNLGRQITVLSGLARRIWIGVVTSSDGASNKGVTHDLDADPLALREAEGLIPDAVQVHSLCTQNRRCGQWQA